MTAPLPNGTDAPPARELGALARKWAYLLSMTSYIPLSHQEMEQRMLELAHEVFAAAAAEPPDVERAAAVGEQLVKLHCVGRASLRSSIDVLVGALMADEQLRRTGDVGERVARTLGAMASGYADTVRWHTVEQQDGLNQALLAAVRNSSQNLADREAECAEVLTELSLLRSQLNHQLLHDVLTGLPNRQFFTTRLERVLNTGTPTSVYRLELAGLATIRDGLGQQAAGLLRIVADRLSGAVAGQSAMVARFEEGHFAVLVENAAPAPDPTPVVEAIRAALAEPAYVDGLAVVVSATIGVVQSPPHRDNPATLLHAADLALRKAKCAGQGRWTLLRPEDDDGDVQELRLAATLLDAWQTGRVHVWFRPQVDLADGRPVRFDALLRWEHPTSGPLPHERCVALAERMDLGGRLGRWLLDRAAERLRAWSGELPLTVMIPPSLATDPELPAIVRRSGFPPERLQVSVPARLAASGPVARLADAGVAVAVHDFGGAACDVTCLSDVPVHAVRLAPDLVRRATEPLVGQAVRDLVALVHLAGATVVVDGVAGDAEADRWREAGADVVTGLLPANVEPPDDIR
jgi:diguanylate cyclase (GGDEF)-like protein